MERECCLTEGHCKFSGGSVPVFGNDELALGGFKGF